MENLLQGIVNGHKETQKKLDEQTDVLKGILNAEKLAAKAEAKRDKREAQVEKRQKSDKSGGLLAGLKKEAKKDKKGGILGALLGGGGIGGIVKLLVGSKLLIAGLVAVIGGAIFAYVKNKKFRDAINTATKNVFDFTVTNILTPGWEWIKKKGPEAYKWIEKEILIPSIKFLKDELGNFYKFATGNKQANSGKDIATDAYRGLLGVLNSGVTGASKRGATRKQLETISDRIIQQDIGFTPGLKGTPEYDAKAEKAEYAQKVAKLLEEKENMEVQLMARKVRVAEGAPWYVSQKDAWKDNEDKQIRNLEKNIGYKVTQIQREQEKALRLLKIDLSGDTVIRRQQGGHINVPGQGSGDKVPMMLPGGSFVMNRNASMMLQAGGMIPTLLEPGEKVFGPGQWGPMEQMMNSTFGRFQKGGEVLEGGLKFDAAGNMLIYKGGKWVLDKPGSSKPEQERSGLPDASRYLKGDWLSADKAPDSKVKAHPGVADTGPGWTVNEQKDKQGRPLILSEGAATAFEKIMKSSGGAVKSTDINSAQRSPAKNTQVEGAQNSNHLYGNALDVQIGSSSHRWMTDNPGISGWHFNDYSPDHPWHWDYTGKGGGTEIPPGSETGIAKQEAAGIGGELGKLLSGMAGAINDIFGDIFGDLLGGLLGDLTGGASDLMSAITGGGGGPRGPAPPVTPGSKGLLDFIAHYESGGDYNKFVGGASDPKISKMTISQIVAYQKANHNKELNSAAIGRYQMLYPDRYIQSAGLTMDSVFSPENQDKLAMAYLEEDGYSKFKSGSMSAKTFAKNVSGTWAAMPKDASGAGTHDSATNQALVGWPEYLAQIKASKLQTGGVANVAGGGSYSSSMVSKSQEQFAHKIAEAMGGPIVVPVPTGGGGGGGTVPQPGNDTVMPQLASSDSSIMAMEYKYRITMGASV
jgi:muramidase (phage lysozyme)